MCYRIFRFVLQISNFPFFLLLIAKFNDLFAAWYLLKGWRGEGEGGEEVLLCKTKAFCLRELLIENWGTPSVFDEGRKERKEWHFVLKSFRYHPILLQRSQLIKMCMWHAYTCTSTLIRGCTCACDRHIHT